VGLEDSGSSTEGGIYDAKSKSSLLSENGELDMDQPLLVSLGTNEGGQSEVDSGSTSGGSSSAGGENDGGNGSAEKELHEILVMLYEDAGVYDTYVREAADNFNGDYLTESKEVREEYYESAVMLTEDLHELWIAVENLEVSSESRYYSQWKDICELYECLYYRIDVIKAAWEISLSYDNPKGHEEEILAPIRADNVDGDNKYYTRFNELYPTIRL
jgi:hypothetical protein